jgi:uncharacterized repeat protein (TIGR02543 family)
MPELSGGNKGERNYGMDIGENGRYWVKVYYIDGMGSQRSMVKTLTIDNIVTQTTIIVKGVNKDDITQVLYEEPEPGLIGIIGVAFDLDGTVMYSTSDGVTMVPGSGAAYTVWARTISGMTVVPPTNQTINIDAALIEVVFGYDLGNMVVVIFDVNSADSVSPSSLPNRYYPAGVGKIFSDDYGPLPILTRNEYTFLGWTTVRDDGTTRVSDMDLVPGSGGSTLKLYALWGQDYSIDLTIIGNGTVKITYDDNGTVIITKNGPLTETVTIPNSVTEVTFEAVNGIQTFEKFTIDTVTYLTKLVEDHPISGSMTVVALFTSSEKLEIELDIDPASLSASTLTYSVNGSDYTYVGVPFTVVKGTDDVTITAPDIAGQGFLRWIDDGSPANIISMTNTSGTIPLSGYSGAVTFMAMYADSSDIIAVTLTSNPVAANMYFKVGALADAH